MTSIDLTGATWRKAKRSTGNGACVEVANDLPGIVAVRDSKDPHGPTLVAAPEAFAAFTEVVKRGL